MSKKLHLGVNHSLPNGNSHRFNLENVKPQIKRVKSKTPGQQEYLEAIDNNRIIFCLGPAGTGKTHLAAGVAARELIEGNIKRIIGIRPTVEVGHRSLGFLPGDLDDKLNPFLRPLLTELSKFFTPEEFRKHRDGEIPVIELNTLQHLRGTTFEDCIVVMDEAQNCTHSEMEMFITRMGYGSTLVINGDTSRDEEGFMRQCDLPLQEQGALEDYARRLGGFENEIAVITLTEEDVVRDPFLKRLMKRLAPKKMSE